IAGCMKKPLGSESQPLVLECLSDANCDDGNPCTIDTCVLLSGGVTKCMHDHVDDPQCCKDMSQCHVASGFQMVACTVTVNPWPDCTSTAGGGTGCCSSPTDCAPEQCHTAACAANLCTYTGTPDAGSGCCADARDCARGNDCQVAECRDFICGLVARQDPGC